MTQSMALATSRTMYGLREPKMKAEMASKANNQRSDRDVSNLVEKQEKNNSASEHGRG